MAHSISYTDSIRQGTDKINQIFGLESGALGSPYELTFNVFQRYRTLTVDADIELTLAASGKVSQSFETLTTTGNGVNILSFPTEWIMQGDVFDPDKIQEIHFRYTGAYVIGVITTLADAPDSTPPIITAASIADATDDELDLTFDEAVNITTAGWSVTASGGAATVDSVAGSGTTTPTFTLSRSIAGTETVTVSYNPASGTTANLDGTELATVTDQAVTNNVITTLLFVPFTGASIDTGAGTVTNPDSANLTISQNNKLIFTRTTDNAVASSVTNFWRSVGTFGRGAYSVLMNRDTGYTATIVVFQYRVDANNDIAIIQKDVDEVIIRVRSGAATVYTLDVTIGVNARFKITYNAAHEIRFWRWNGSAWAQLGTTQTFDIGSAGTINLSSASAAADAAGDAFSFDDVYVTDKDYTTVTP